MRNTQSENNNEKKFTPLCRYSKKCGSCRLQNLPYEQQLSLKQRNEIKLLGKFCHVDEIIGMDNPLHYRNKLQAIAAGNGKNPFLGIYQSTSGNVLKVGECLIEDEQSRAISETVERLMISFKLKAYNPQDRRGFLRHVMIRKGFSSGQIMVVLVTGKGGFPSQRSFVNALVAKHPEITTIVRNINDSDVPLMLGKISEVLYGNGYIEDTLCGKIFRISPRSFWQVNSVQTEVLYGKAAEFAGLSGKETVVDAYCGTGTIGIILSGKAKKIIGTEVSADAVYDAKKNAALNGIKNAEFFCCDAGEFMTEYKESGEKVDVVVTDPPRAGCSREFLKSLVKLAPKKIVYVSCNPETLARDLSYLIHNGYHCEKIQPVDMFPFTSHVESVVLLSRT